MIETKFKNTEIGPIPVDWEVVPLNQFFEFGNGYTPSTENPKFWAHKGLPWFKMEDIRKNGRILSDSILHITPAAVKGRGLFPAGSFILSTTATIGEHAWLIADSLANQRFTFLTKGKSLKNIASRYFFYKLYEIGEWCRKNVSKSTLMAVDMVGLKNYPLTVPPLAEQEAIGVALREVDELIEGLKKLVAKKRAIKQGAMSQLLSGKSRLPGFSEPWKEVTLGEIGDFYKGKGIARAEAMSGIIPAIRYGEIYTHHHDYIRKFNSFISRRVAESSFKLSQGDICFAGSGETLEEIGKAVAFIQETEAYAGGDIVILRPKKNICSLFLGFAVNMPKVAHQKANKGSGVSIMHITAKGLAEIVVNVPPSLAEQEAIAKVLTDMDAEIEALSRKVAKYEQVKQGMMQQLLTGKIRLVQHPIA